MRGGEERRKEVGNLPSMLVTKSESRAAFCLREKHLLSCASVLSM